MHALDHVSSDVIRAVAARHLHVEDLNTQLRLLPLHSRLRVPLISKIRDVEDIIGRTVTL